MRENRLKTLFHKISIALCACCLFALPAQGVSVGTFIGGISTSGTWGNEIYYRNDMTAGVATVKDMSTSTTSTTNIQLTAGEWRINTTNYGAVIGASVCNANSSNAIGDKSSSAQTESGGANCWCKTTGIAGTDGKIQQTSGGSWVYGNGFSDASGCVGGCAYACAFNGQSNSGFRVSLLNGVSTASIEVATTKYVEEQFTPISTELNTTIGTIKTVVENTITQADRISALHTDKQNRPDDYNDDEKCPDGYNCLLISDANGVPHWYPIVTGDTSNSGSSSSTFNAGTFFAQLVNNGDSHYYMGNTTTYSELGGVNTVSASQPAADSGLRQLQSTEWAVKWNNIGAIYGTSVCCSNNGNQGTVSTEQTESKGTYCWCKMTSVAGTDVAEHSVVSSWVYAGVGYGSALNCASYCASKCGDVVKSDTNSLRTSMVSSI